MKKVSLRNVSVNDRLAVDIKIKSSRPDVQHRLIIERGTKLKPKHINRLKKEGIRSVFITDPMTDDLVDRIYDEDIKEAEEELTESLRDAAMNLNESEVFNIPSEKLSENILSLIDTLRESDASLAFTTLKSHADYLAKHAFDVCKLSINFFLNYQEKLIDLYKSESNHNADISANEFSLNLGLGSMLLDVGNWEIPEEILRKSSELTEVEWEAIKRHPRMGFEALNDLNGLDVSCRLPALEHHERFNGDGYPRGLSEGDIHLFSRISAISDVYTALTTERPYRIELTPNRALEVMKSMQEDSPAFDPELMDLFLDMMPPFPIGQEVVLSDGTRGVVSGLENGFKTPEVRVLYDGKEKLDDYYHITANKSDTPKILN